MKIASWNVNSIKARLTHVTSWLEKNQPDLLLIQELKGLDFPIAPFEELGYNALAVTQKAYNGVAILSKHPIKQIRDRLPGNKQDEQARYLETDMNGLRVINIYLPNGNPVESDKFAYKIGWMDRLIKHLKELKEKETPFLIGGDFNVIPEDADCHDPKAWEGDALFHLRTRRRFRAMLNLGLTDAFRVYHPGQPGHYTFWDYQGGAWPADKGIRIDHFLLSPAVTDRLRDCYIDKAPRAQDKPSDHTPILIEIARGGG